VVSPDGSQIVIAGNFTSVNGSSAPGYGLARLDAATGASLSMPVNNEVRDAGDESAMLALETDGTYFYGSGYHFGGGGNSEGTFSADWATGSLRWLEDCHGDTYSIYPVGNVVYQASHKHYCGNSAGFPQTDPWTFHHSTAVTNDVRGVNTADIYGYPDHPGTPRPEFLDWYPTWAAGTYTGKTQAVWTVTGNSDYVLYGGEFPRINNVPQQGLVRFARKGLAPNKIGPTAKSAKFDVRAISLSGGAVRVSWPGNFDPDNATITYKLYRQSTNNPPIYQKTVSAHFWAMPPNGFTDTGLTPGSTQRYRVIAEDPFGNQALSDWITVTVSDAPPLSGYGKAVLDDNPVDFWRLGEGSGTTSYDWAGLSDLTRQSGTGWTTGATSGDPDGASTFNGTSTGFANTTTGIPGPNTFSIEAWFKTTTTRGGKIVGFGSTATGTSNSYDRHIYMRNDGRLLFGVFNGSTVTLQSSGAYNDGQWHQVVGALSPAGMLLYVDGRRVASRAATNAQAFNGYWRVGGDNLNSWPSQPFSRYFSGSIDDVSIWDKGLTASDVADHYLASGRTLPGGVAPADAYGKAVYQDGPDLYWRFSETAGSSIADATIFGNGGQLAGGYTRGVAGPLAGVSASKAVTFNGFNGTAYSTTQFTNPSTYSLEAWFKTGTNRGGKIIGFGNHQADSSDNYDRHVYMQDDGTLVFGVWTGTANTITTSNAFNDNQWHHVVATQGGDGMKLYVDGALRGTNPQTAAQDYSGYWRVGGDSDWGGSSAYLNGSIAEVAVYSSVLSASTVAAHHEVGVTGMPANAAPTAAFTSSMDKLTASVDGSTSSDTDGTIASYSWNFGDGTPAVSGATATHTYAAAGTYDATLTVTDDRGAQGTVTHQLTAVANEAPVAAFTASPDKLKVSADGSGSSDPDGTIASYSWNFGDGTPAASGVTPTHTYAAAGTYTVTLTVTDDDGTTGSVQHDVTVSANAAPLAAFTSSATGLSVSTDGSGSSDPDGSVASYAWDFGDGSPTASGATASHTYGADGTYTVTLTVTDDDGLTGSVQHDVTVTAPANGLIAADGFARTLASTWGPADVGGPWSMLGASSRFSVAGGTGIHTVPAGATVESQLASVSATDVDLTVSVGVDKLPASGYVFAWVGARVSGTTGYWSRVRINPDGTVGVHILRDATALVGSSTVSGLTYTAGDRLNVRFQAEGSSPTTLRVKVWRAGTTEPALWTYTRTDATAANQGAGAVSLRSYAPNTGNNPIAVSYDELAVTQL